VEAYTGFEPLVGEIRAVRTFSIGPDGELRPLREFFGAPPWTAQVNTARCLPSDGSGLPRPSTPDKLPHDSPDPGCTCGFYAYGTPGAAEENSHARSVLAVVSCWGRVIAGTRGIRAQHARIDAIWMSEYFIPAILAERVAARYPGVAVYADRDAMLAAHPPTELDCYEDTSRDAMLAAHPPTEGAGRKWWLKRAIIWLAATAALWWWWWCWVSYPVRDEDDRPRLVTGAERGVKRELFKLRCKQLWQAFQQQRRDDKMLLPLVIGSIVAVSALAFGIGLIFGMEWFALPAGVAIGVLVAVSIFGRRLQNSMYAKADGQAGAAGWVLNIMRGSWWVTQAVASNVHLDAVHRVTGRPGVVLVAEGAPHRVKTLLAQEKERTARIVGSTPIYDFIVGNDEGQTPLKRLQRDLTKLPRNLTLLQKYDIQTRLSSPWTERVAAPAGPVGAGPAAAWLPDRGLVLGYRIWRHRFGGPQPDRVVAEGHRYRHPPRRGHG
jgi:uncharacterized protein DUF4191